MTDPPAALCAFRNRKRKAPDIEWTGTTTEAYRQEVGSRKTGPMMTWLKRQAPSGRNRNPAEMPAPGKPQPAAVPAEYLSLHKYLDDRYANTVVLTFAEIEDLLGFTLPDIARLQHEWWANADANSSPSAQSRSWSQARRTARPNLLAQTVMFERAQA
jgi:hypothetical protein